MLRQRQAVYLVPALILTAVLVTLPTSANANRGNIPCQTVPSYVGHDDATEAWFRYPQGRNAEHITAGTFTVAAEDFSSLNNFRLRDLTWQGQHLDMSTTIPGQGEECWTVTFEVGDYEWIDEGNPDFMRGVIVSHPAADPPPPPPGPPPPPSPAGPPPPPPPPAQPDLIATVGPEARIAVFYADGRRVTRLPPGTYTIQVHDLSSVHDFHLKGPGVDERTSVAEIEHPIWRLTLREGTYTFKCDVHPSIKGSLVVATGAPPLTRCKVPRVIGKNLGPARRAIRAAHCSVGRVRYTRSKRGRGRVVAQTPRAGRTLAAATKVNLVVSRGPT